MASIIWPTTSSPGLTPQENGGRLINALAEPLSEGARTRIVRRRVPGLREVARTETYSGCRGFRLIGSTLLMILEDRALAVAMSGGGYTVTDLGALLGSLPVTIAHNNAATPNIVAVTENGAFNLFTGSAPTAFADLDLPQPNSVTFMDGYLFFTLGDGRVFASGLNAVTINALDFTKANARPGGLTRGIAFAGLLYLFGPNATEVYQNTGNPTGFPFSRATVIEIGLASAFAVAGHEEGWANALIFVGDDDIVYQLQGYTAVPISTPDVTRSIKAVADRDDLEAKVYMAGGNPIWSLSGPEFTWEFNLRTGYWHERKSLGTERWRAQCSVKAFGYWLVGEASSGKLFAIDEEVHREGDDELVWEVRSVQGSVFPSTMAVPKADFDFVVGVGSAAGEDPIEADPIVEISWSDDGGRTFGNSLPRALGGEGEFQQRISLRRTGRTTPKGRQWKLTCSDPVYVGLLDGSQDVRPRAA